MQKLSNEKGKILIHIIRVLFSVLFYFIVLPALVVAIANYIKYVIQGSIYFKEYLKALPEYSYQPVFTFYADLWDNITAFVDKMKNTKVFE